MCVADISAFYQTVSSILCKSNENFKKYKSLLIFKSFCLLRGHLIGMQATTVSTISYVLR